MKKIISLTMSLVLLLIACSSLCVSAGTVVLNNRYGFVEEMAQVSDISGIRYEYRIVHPDGDVEDHKTASNIVINGKRVEDARIKVGSYIFYRINDNDEIDLIKYDQNHTVKLYDNMRFNPSTQCFYGNGVTISRNSLPLYLAVDDTMVCAYPDGNHTYTMEVGTYHMTILDYDSDKALTIKNIYADSENEGMKQYIWVSGWVVERMSPSSTIWTSIYNASNILIGKKSADYVGSGGGFEVLYAGLPNENTSYTIKVWVEGNSGKESLVYTRRCTTRKVELIQGTVDAAAIRAESFEEMVECRVNLQDGTKRVYVLADGVEKNDDYYWRPEDVLNALTTGSWITFFLDSKGRAENVNVYNNKPITVRFDMNDGRGVVDSQTVEKASQLYVPEVTRKDGFVFMGWYANPVGNGQPYITAGGTVQMSFKNDVTLYAVQRWGQSIEWGVDTFKFGNAPYFWGSDYTITDEHFNKLTAGLNYKYRTLLKKQRKAEYNGSCYGMSVVLTMLKNGYLRASDIEKGANNVHDLSYPKNSKAVASVLNYYQLSQFLPDVQDEIKKQSSSGTKTLAKKLLIDYMRDGLKNEPVVIIYEYKDGKKWYQHAVVSYRMEEEEFGYRLLIVDPNMIVHSDPFASGLTFIEETEPSYMYIDADGSDVSYKGFEGEHSLRAGTLRLCSVFFDDSIYDDIALMSLEEENVEQAVLSVNFDAFDIECEGGSASVVPDGTTGTLEVSEGRVYADEDFTEYTMPYEDYFTIEAKENDREAYCAEMNFDSIDMPMYIFSEAKEPARFFFDAYGSAGVVTPSESEKNIMMSATEWDWCVSDIIVSAQTAELFVERQDDNSFCISASSSLQGAVFTVTDANGGTVTAVVEDDVKMFTVTCEYDSDSIIVNISGTNHDSAFASEGSVVFCTNGGTEMESITGLESGATISRPEDPAKEGFVFTGWYSDEFLETEWDFENDCVYGCTMLYAGWEPEEDAYHTATLCSGDTMMQIIFSGNENIDLAEYTTVIEGAGETIVGWSTNADAEEAEYATDAILAVSGDVTLYAMKTVRSNMSVNVTPVHSELYVNISVNHADENASVYVAAYKENNLVYMERLSDFEGSRDVSINSVADEIRVMLWSGNGMTPATDAFVLKESDWGIED